MGNCLPQPGQLLNHLQKSMRLKSYQLIKFCCTRPDSYKLSEFVIHDKYGDLYEELTVNRGKYNEESLLFYDIILNSVINKPALSNDLILKFRKQFTSANDTRGTTHGEES